MGYQMTTPAAQPRAGATGEMRCPVQLGGRGPLAGWSQERPAELAHRWGLLGLPAKHGQAPPETAHLLQRLQYAIPSVYGYHCLSECLG